MRFLQVWQYVTLIKRINLIDCPGVVHSTTEDTQTSTVLKGVVRVEHLEDATQYVSSLLNRVKPEYITRAYCVKSWTDHEDFLSQMGKRSGKLLKGGDPDLNTVARMVLQDWQKGRIPYFTLPPDYVLDLPGKQSREQDRKGGASLKERDEEKIVSKAQEAITDISIQVAEQIGNALPQKKGYFMPEDAMEDGAPSNAPEFAGDVEYEADGVDHGNEFANLLGRVEDSDKVDKNIEESPEGVSDVDSDGYGEDGLSWEAVMASMKEVDANVEEDENPEEIMEPNPKRIKQ